jgi:hypothetical protein
VLPLGAGRGRGPAQDVRAGVRDGARDRAGRRDPGLHEVPRLVRAGAGGRAVCALVTVVILSDPLYFYALGWQVGLLLGDLMEVIEKKVEEENRRTAALQKENAQSETSSTWYAEESGSGGTGVVARTGSRMRGRAAADSGLPREGEGNKFAGFFV